MLTSKASREREMRVSSLGVGFVFSVKVFFSRQRWYFLPSLRDAWKYWRRKIKTVRIEDFLDRIRTIAKSNSDKIGTRMKRYRGMLFSLTWFKIKEFFFKRKSPVVRPHKHDQRGKKGSQELSRNPYVNTQKRELGWLINYFRERVGGWWSAGRIINIWQYWKELLERFA